MPGAHGKDKVRRLRFSGAASAAPRLQPAHAARATKPAARLFAECTDAESRAVRTMGFVARGDAAEGLGDYKKAPAMARPLVNSGWLPQLSVFDGLRREDTTVTEEETTAAGEESAWARKDRYKGFYPAGTVSLIDSTG